MHSNFLDKQFQRLTFRKDILSEDEIKEGVDNQIDVLHPPGVPLGRAPVLGGGGQRLVDDLMVQHPLHPPGAGLLLGVILGLEIIVMCHGLLSVINTKYHTLHPPEVSRQNKRKCTVKSRLVFIVAIMLLLYYR